MKGIIVIENENKGVAKLIAVAAIWWISLFSMLVSFRLVNSARSGQRFSFLFHALCLMTLTPVEMPKARLVLNMVTTTTFKYTRKRCTHDNTATQTLNQTACNEKSANYWTTLSSKRFAQTSQLSHHTSKG